MRSPATGPRTSTRRPTGSSPSGSSGQRTSKDLKIAEPSANADVTVVIPCFNQGDLLREAVDSALGQGGGPPKVIIVDDGSTDSRTAGVIAALPDGVEVVTQANAGVAAARNTGLARAGTPFVMWLDGDDRYLPTTIATLKRTLRQDPEAGYAYGVMRYFGDWTGEVAFPGYDSFTILYRPIVAGPALTRREAFEATGGFDTELEGYEDWDLFLGLLEAGWHGVRTDEVVLDYRKHGDSGLSGDRRNHRRIYRAIRRKRRDLFKRSGELAKTSYLGPVNRAFHRSYWAWRPVPARLEAWLYGLYFRRSLPPGPVSQKLPPPPRP